MTILWYLNDFFMILLSDWWYFYDTSCKIIQNVSFFYLIICQLFIFTFSQKNDTLRLFHKKTFFVRAHTQRYIQKVSDIKSYRYKKIHHDVNFNAKKIRIIPYFLLVFSSRIITQLSPVGKLREVREKLRDKCPTSYSKKLLSHKSVTHPRRT